MYIYIYICLLLTNNLNGYEYFGGHGNGDGADIYIPIRIPYAIEKVGDSPYPYLYLVNAGISRQNGDKFGQYPQGQVYLSSLVTRKPQAS